jgi:hypothetical protein
MLGRGDKSSDLERVLRAERPQAPDEFVERLSARVSGVALRRSRRTLIPRVALILGATLLLGLSLGVAGAIGSAQGSIQAFGRGVYHVVSPLPDHTTGTAAAPNTTSGSGQAQDGNSQVASGLASGRIRDPALPPFGFQYGIKVPICYQGHVLFVPISELLYYFFHGGLPVWACFIHR